MSRKKSKKRRSTKGLMSAETSIAEVAATLLANANNLATGAAQVHSEASKVAEEAAKVRRELDQITEVVGISQRPDELPSSARSTPEMDRATAWDTTPSCEREILQSERPSKEDV